MIYCKVWNHHVVLFNSSRVNRNRPSSHNTDALWQLLDRAMIRQNMNNANEQKFEHFPDCKTFSHLNLKIRNFTRKHLHCFFFVCVTLLNKNPNMNLNAIETPSLWIIPDFLFIYFVKTGFQGRTWHWAVRSEGCNVLTGCSSWLRPPGHDTTQEAATSQDVEV